MTEAQPTSIEWVSPSGPLGDLVATAERRAAELVGGLADLERAARASEAPPSFRAALGGEHVAVIAEFKRRSPSQGVIGDGLDAPARARAYEAGGARALSVLTEPTRFGGSLDDLRAIRRATGVPLLRKDFIVQRVQLLEARVEGASAVLLIARALPPAHFTRLSRDALDLGLEVLLEVRTEAELGRALGMDDAMIGVNNRDLETLEVDEATSERLLPLVPAGRIAVSESGIRDRRGVERAAALGADAVLVGSSLSSSSDGARAVSALVGVPKRGRGR